MNRTSITLGTPCLRQGRRSCTSSNLLSLFYCSSLALSLLILASPTAALAQTVTTDLPDYPPGSTVYISGAGFAPGETVQCQVLHIPDTGDNNISPAHLPWTVTADPAGNIATTWQVPVDEDELGATLQLTAVGQTSGLIAQTTFTDAHSIDLSLTKSGSPSTVNAGANISYTIVVTNTDVNNDSTGTVTDSLPAGTTFVSETHDTNLFNVTTPAVGSSGTITWTGISNKKGFPKNNETATFTLVVQVDCSVANNSTIANTASVSIDGSSGDTDPNLANNSQTATTTVNNPPPSFGATCPSDLMVNTGPGNTTCSQTASWTPPTATDTCGSVSVTSNHNPGDTFLVGQTTVTYTATDAAGGQTQCSFKVTVVDDTPPTITCPANLTDVHTDPGQCSATGVSLGVPGATNDNCGLLTVTNDAPATFPHGTTTVHWTAVDTSGNTTTCNQLVTVVDHEPPTITCPANLSDVHTDPGQCSATGVSLGVPSATNDNCGLLTVTNDAPATFPHGTTTVHWTAVDTSGNTTTCAQLVTVVDHEPPTITCPANLTDVHTDPGQCSATGVSLGVPSATNDNCGLLTVTNDAPATFPHGTTTVHWTAVDTSGNTTTCNQLVTVVDHEPPTITCPANLTDVHTDPGQCSATGVSLGVPSATNDNCGLLTVTNDAPATFPHGTTTVHWTAVDTSGNTTTCNQLVTVVDHEPPTITCPANLSDVHTDPGQCSATGVSLGVPSATNDNCGLLTVTNDAPATFPHGTTTVHWTAVDTSGNTTTCDQLVTVVDHEPPTPDAASLADVTGQCSADLPAAPTATDNCDGTITGVPDLTGPFGQGDYTITWTFTDGSGNSSTQTQDVHVHDTMAPSITSCPTNITVKSSESDPTKCTQVVTWTEPNAADNCGAPSLTSDHSSGDEFPVGDTLVTYTAKDGVGLTTTCSFTVTVVDDTPPIITCPPDMTVSDGGAPSAPVTYPNPTASDNCTVTNVSSVPPSGSNFPVGTTTVTCTATDSSGNTASCSFNVTRNPACVYSFSGFLPPIGGADATGGTCANSVRTFKLGSTIPVKFILTCGGTPVATGIHTLSATKCSGTVDSTNTVVAIATDAATTGNQFRITDSSTGEWHFNLDTKAGFTSGSWKLTATLSDGSTHFVYIGLKR